MKNLRSFQEFLNEGQEYSSKEMDQIIADALGCKPVEVETKYFMGSPTNDVDEVEDMRDLFNSTGEDGMGGETWELKKPGKILYSHESGTPDGDQTAHYFEHNGMKVVVVEGEDGPFIYAK